MNDNSKAISDVMSAAEHASSTSPADDRVTTLAFYLPQFHPVPVNDFAWGRGFTEWTNVSQAKPLYGGHHQPQLPADMGFYDLRDPSVLRRQADLAREFDLGGFCFYHYWFDGRRVLETPVDLLISDPTIDIPFCLCWANETWSRRWDGSEHEIIIQQTFDENAREAFITDLLPYLTDPRYIRVDGKPMVIIYRPDIIADLQRTVQIWRETAQANGIELHLCACSTFGFNDPMGAGFDAVVEFPPHGVSVPEIQDKVDWNVPFTGRAYEYEDVVQSELAKPEPNYPLYRSCMVAWDNTARRKSASNLFMNSTPQAFEAWLTALVWRARQIHPVGQRFIFINAWNEWAEGAHLEPDLKWGRQYLQALRRALRPANRSVMNDKLAEIVTAKLADLDPKSADLSPEHTSFLLAAVESLLEERSRSHAIVSRIGEFMASHLSTQGQLRASRFGAAHRVGTETVATGKTLSYLETPAASNGAAIALDPLRSHFFKGWAVPADKPEAIISAFRAVLLSTDGSDEQRVLMLPELTLRADVAALYDRSPNTEAALCGFHGFLDFKGVPAGKYDFRIDMTLGREICRTDIVLAVEVLP